MHMKQGLSPSAPTEHEIFHKAKTERETAKTRQILCFAKERQNNSTCQRILFFNSFDEPKTFMKPRFIGIQVRRIINL